MMPQSTPFPSETPPATTNTASRQAGMVFSLVAPVYNEEATIPHFYARIVAIMDQLGEPYELILVNDGSTDRSFQEMRMLHEQDRRVRILDFSRNFGHQAALSAGIEYARGQAVITRMLTFRTRLRSFHRWSNAGEREQRWLLLNVSGAKPRQASKC
jgi:hypothetical protein